MTVHSCVLRQNNPDHDYKFCRSCLQGKEIAAKVGVEIVKRCKYCGAKIRYSKRWNRPDNTCQSCIERHKARGRQSKKGAQDE